MNSIFTSSYRNIFIAGLIVFIIGSIFSSGYFHYDEHFQILEFGNYLLGNSSASDLPWEFKEKIRPTLQPVLSVLVIKSVSILGIYNPFTYSFLLRFVSALFSWFLICKICLHLLNNFNSEKGKKFFLLVNFFSWFIPLISVRFSSENYSALTFLSAIYFIIQFNNDNEGRKILNLILAGFLLGLSFFFRFQIGFAIAGLGLWFIFIQKIKWNHLVVLAFSGLLSIAICITIDCWIYGEFVITPLNYFKANILENRAAEWGIYPWYYYFIDFVIRGIPPISIILLLLFIIGLYNKPKSLFTWVIVAFLFGHFIIGHKELRFLFPMAFCFTYLAAVGFEYFLNNFKMNFLWKSIGAFSLVLNLFLLTFILFTPAQPIIKYYKYIYNLAKQREVVLICKGKSIYELADLNVNFYKSKNVKCLVFNNESEILNYLNNNSQTSALLIERNFSNQDNYPSYTMETIYCILPPWFTHLNYNNWISRSGIWKIQELKKNN